MILTACYCAWDIPGVENLPAHSHLDQAILRRQDDGYETRVPLSAIRPSTTSVNGLDVVDRVEAISVWVDWKAVARALAQPSHAGVVE